MTPTSLSPHLLVQKPVVTLARIHILWHARYAQATRGEMGGLETPSTSHRAPAGADGKDRQTKVGPHYVCMRGIYIRSNQWCQTSQGANVPHPQPLEELLSKSPLLADLLQAEAEEEVIRLLLAPKALFLLLSH